MDVVITYVDITERFKDQYFKYVKKELEENRFRSYGVLDLQIKGIRKYMPYIKNIFVVVSEKEQVEGIDLSDAIIIEHKDIIPERYLPCFNSCSIEMFLWKIPGLAEEFIYFNDDIFVIDKIHPSKWFIKGKPVLFPKEHEIKEEENIFKRNCINSSKLAIDITGSNIKDKYFTQTHCARPFLKSSCEKVFNLKVLDIIHSLTRTRHSKNYNASLFNNYDYLSGKAYKMEVKYTYTNAYNTEEEIINYINEKENSLICINDTDYYIDFDEFKAEIRKALEANLKGKKYVKEIKKEKIKEIILNNTPLKVALCTIAKNENLYIREWVEWYKNLGISKIFLYDNNELDGERFEDVINDYIESGFVEVINVRGIEKGCVYDEEGINLQPKCYLNCYKDKANNFDWICFFDVDEFLTFRNNYNLFSFLNDNRFNNFDTILVGWEHYDDNNLIYYENKPVVERFTHRSKYNYHCIKSIVRGGKEIINIKENDVIHTIRVTGNKVIRADYIPHTISLNLLKYNNLNEHNAVLNHYKTKSAEEYIKRHLGRHWGTGKVHTDKPKDFNNCIVEYFRYNEKTQEKQDFFYKYNRNTVNENLIILNERILVTMTSWKARINDCYRTLEILINNSIRPDKVFLVLAKEEFPNKLNDLPSNLLNLRNKYNNFEIKWVDKNTNVFKKLIPIIDKYRDDLIITTDDDILYPKDLIENVIQAYINDGAWRPLSFGSYHSDWKINDNIKINSHYGACSIVKFKYFGEHLWELYKKTTLERINTGIKCYDDVLYTYAALLNGYKYKRCETYSVRKYVLNSPQLSSPFSENNSKNNLELLKDYHNCIRKYISNKYNKTIEELVNNYSPIVSFTSYKPRLQYCKTVIDSILQNTYKPFKIILTLSNKDIQYIPQDLQEYIDKNIIELLIANIDLKPHNKYFYSMQKYRENPIITIDDDIIYPKDLIESLYKSYINYPNCISARRVHKKTYDKNHKLNNYKKWIFENQDILDPSYELLCTGIGGILYPPDILKISDDNIKDIQKVITVDDIYLHYLELKNNIKCIYVKNNINHPPIINGSQDVALYKSINNFNSNINKNDEAINILLK